MLLQELQAKKLIHPPSWLPLNSVYLTAMGSFAYGVSSDTSDYDVYGFAIPQRDVVFPHLAGVIDGFDTKVNRFEQWEEHHCFDKDALGGDGRSYDFSVFGIVKYFRLLMDNNPNIIDSIYTPTNCVLHCTKVGNMVRDNRRIFLHKGAWHRFRGYSYSMLHKTGNKMTAPEMQSIIRFENDNGIDRSTTFSEVEKELEGRSGGSELRGRLSDLDHKVIVEYYKMYKTGMDQSKRFEKRKVQETDTKYLYHLVRLLDECEQIMIEGDIDLQRNREQLKSIRRGEWTEIQIRDYFTRKETELAKVYQDSKLPHSPDEEPIKKLLINCLEEHYGNLSSCIAMPDRYLDALRNVRMVLESVGV